MKLRKAWYPYTLPERAAWHFNFKTKAVESGTAYGLTAAQVEQIVADAELVEFLNEYEEYLETEMKNWRDMRDAYLDGDEGVPEPKVPAFDIPALPAAALTAIAERTERYADKIKASDDYTPSVGAAYGIVAAKPEPSPVESKKPVAKYSTGAEFKAIFKVPMQGMKAIQMQMERDGDPTIHKTMWTEGEITDDTPPLAAGKAETRRYRFYFFQKSEIVGESSDVYEVTVHA